jgi:hypothetical protein
MKSSSSILSNMFQSRETPLFQAGKNHGTCPANERGEECAAQLLLFSMRILLKFGNAFLTSSSKMNKA